MKIPKGTDIRVDTSNEIVELHITAAITTNSQAKELAAAIRACVSACLLKQRNTHPQAEAAASGMNETTQIRDRQKIEK